jgi:mannosyltransferase OCH1-like enzyme
MKVSLAGPITLLYLNWGPVDAANLRPVFPKNETSHSDFVTATQQAVVSLQRSWSETGEKQWSKYQKEGAKIPCHIHQTWKTNQLEPDAQAAASTWQSSNPGCGYTLWSDDDINKFAQESFADSIGKIWSQLLPIQRADAFRYMVILKKGGYYADVDVTCQRPITSWGIPENVALIAGYEAGRELGEEERRNVLFGHREQVQQWFFAAAPGHPVLERTLELLLKRFQEGQRETIALTGPGVWSEAVHGFLHEVGGVQNVPNALDIPSHQAVGPDGAKVWMLNADEVAVGGYSVNSFGNEVIHHAFKGSWKR